MANPSFNNNKILPNAPAAGVPGERPDDCLKVSRQYADVSLPIEIIPQVCAGCIEAECCGEPVVLCKDNCCGGSCEITITQKVEIRIPLKFSVNVEMGESAISCTAYGVCCD